MNDIHQLNHRNVESRSSATLTHLREDARGEQIPLDLECPSLEKHSV